jgi:5S rRNA maturation endonuclease (ribonuclease M5)
MEKGVMPKSKSDSGVPAGLVLPYHLWCDDPSDTVICEGEKDMLFARMAGYNAISLGGCNNIPHVFLESFRDRKVYIVYDNDNAGRAGATKLANALYSVTKEVYIADILDGRLEMAKSFGADGVINTKTQNLAEETKRITGGNGFDVCVEACGAAETFLACIDSAAFAANIILIGNGKKETTFLHSILLKKELNVYGSRNSFKKDFEELIDIVADKKADILKMISAVYPVDDVSTAFEKLAHNDGSLAKVLVEVSAE